MGWQVLSFAYFGLMEGFVVGCWLLKAVVAVRSEKLKAGQ